MVSRNEWKYVADLELELDPTLPAVPCYPGELNQVVLNLIINAAHAISESNGDGSGEKGGITVGTKVDQDCVEIWISDTGPGIPEEVRLRIFEPFFTTKGVGRGTGQGLSIARAIIVEKHGGALSFDTTVGQGTTFRILLPVEGDSGIPGTSPREVNSQSE